MFTNIDFESFSTYRRQITATNTKGQGRAYFGPTPMVAGLSYRIVFDALVESGDPPNFMISMDGSGSNPLFIQRIKNGPQTIVVKTDNNGTYFPVFHVASNNKSAFSIHSFKINEVFPIEPLSEPVNQLNDN
jgi:hypothetical protein